MFWGGSLGGSLWLDAQSVRKYPDVIGSYPVAFTGCSLRGPSPWATRHPDLDRLFAPIAHALNVSDPRIC